MPDSLASDDGDTPESDGHDVPGTDHADVRYLTAKRSVDERARDRRVRERLLADLPESPRVVDLGAGTGATLRALFDWGATPAEYRGIDRSAAVLDHARESVPDADIDVTFETGDLREQGADDADLVVAQAVLDLVSLEEGLETIERLLAPGGLAYCPITFDGVSLFQPDHPADAAVVDAYHAHIDAQPGRDSRAGRHLLDLLRTRDGHRLLAAGSSDWIVRPHADGDGYPADEEYFLSRILAFVEAALEGSTLPEDTAREWLDARRRHLADGELTYVAHQYDLLWRYEGGGAPSRERD